MKVATCCSFLACLVLSTAAPSADQTTVHARIAAGVGAIRLVDTHEHISAEAERLKTVPSLFSLLHYVSSDMWADGMDRAMSERTLGSASIPLAKQWELIAPYWANVRTTAYGRSLLRAVRDLYGIDDISEATYAEISRRVSEANRPGWYEYVLKKRAGIDIAISDVGSSGAALDPALFRAVIRLDHFLVVPQGLSVVQREQGVTIGTLEEWEHALQSAVASAREKKFVGIKSAVAYQRSLDFSAVDRAEAEALFNQARDRGVKPGPADWGRDKALQDYMFGKIADACARYDLPLQIHTGFFFDTWRNVTQANPAHLIPFIIRHKNTRFVLMHSGYPYGPELLAMAKNLPNVTIDMSWTYVISPSFAARFLDEAIETVPADKILGFGGDYQVPEGAYAHAMLCREVVAKVLADKVTAGYWSEEEALGFARAILRDNAIRAFGLAPDTVAAGPR
ncbi:MAG TPA: amidohydrolase family protein [Vicinamibacterales bacterium]|nr:amidohydrolase family protein [Vicinamibacterales bacterium]